MTFGKKTADVVLKHRSALFATETAISVGPCVKGKSSILRLEVILIMSIL
jgi:hypothetical protein